MQYESRIQHNTRTCVEERVMRSVCIRFSSASTRSCKWPVLVAFEWFRIISLSCFLSIEEDDEEAVVMIVVMIELEWGRQVSHQRKAVYNSLLKKKVAFVKRMIVLIILWNNFVVWHLAFVASIKEKKTIAMFELESREVIVRCYLPTTTTYFVMPKVFARYGLWPMTTYYFGMDLVSFAVIGHRIILGTW